MADHDSEIDGLIDEHRDLMAIMGKLKRAVSEPDSNVDEILDELEMRLHTTPSGKRLACSTPFTK